MADRLHSMVPPPSPRREAGEGERMFWTHLPWHAPPLPRVGTLGAMLGLLRAGRYADAYVLALLHDLQSADLDEMEERWARNRAERERLTGAGSPPPEEVPLPRAEWR